MTMDSTLQAYIPLWKFQCSHLFSIINHFLLQGPLIISHHCFPKIERHFSVIESRKFSKGSAASSPR